MHDNSSEGLQSLQVLPVEIVVWHLNMGISLLILIYFLNTSFTVSSVLACQAYIGPWTVNLLTQELYVVALPIAHKQVKGMKLGQPVSGSCIATKD